MADIRFEEDQGFSPRNAEPQESALIRLVFSTGLAKTREDAQYVLVGVVVVFVLLSLFLLSSSSKKPASNSYQEGQSVLLPQGEKP